MMRRIILFLLILILYSQVCLAESFFPSTNELFGQTMPSISFITGREADAEEKVEGGTIYLYQDFSAHEYTAFSKYLAEEGCTVVQASIENKVLTAQITKENGTVTIEYDYPARMATMFYPDNNRKEETTDNIFIAIKNFTTNQNAMKCYRC